ncbi:unnamed protein product [Lampetra planeri]
MDEHFDPADRLTQKYLEKREQAGRQSQQQWEKELQEREMRLKREEEVLGRLSGLEEMLHTRLLDIDEKHRQELDQLNNLLREKNKENKRLKSSFDTMKALNENMKKQLDEVNEQNKKLSIQSKRVQARLENLQRKNEHCAASNPCNKADVEVTKPPKNGGKKTVTSGKFSSKVLENSTVWMSVFTSRGFAAQFQSSLIMVFFSFFFLSHLAQVLPLVVEQLHHTPVSEHVLLLKLLRLVHSALKHMEIGTQHVALSVTLRRLGEAVSKLPALRTDAQAGGPEPPGSPLLGSPCPHTRLLSALIILRTVTQADVLATALDSLHTELMHEESRGLFLHYGGVQVLLSALRAGHGGRQSTVDILMQLTGSSRYLKSFLDACSCEEFFQMASQLIKNPHLELQSLEKLSILLQKLSGIRKNQRLFEQSSLRLQIQELHHKTDNAHAFLCLNFRSILTNLR